MLQSDKYLVINIRKYLESHDPRLGVLWSSFFVTLVAKK